MYTRVTICKDVQLLRKVSPGSNQLTKFIGKFLPMNGTYIFGETEVLRFEGEKREVAEALYESIDDTVFVLLDELNEARV